MGNKQSSSKVSEISSESLSPLSKSQKVTQKFKYLPEDPSPYNGPRYETCIGLVEYSVKVQPMIFTNELKFSNVTDHYELVGQQGSQGWKLASLLPVSPPSQTGLTSFVIKNTLVFQVER